MGFNPPLSLRTLTTGLILVSATFATGDRAQAVPFTRTKLGGQNAQLGPAAEANFRVQAAALKAELASLTPVQRKLDFNLLEEGRRRRGTSTLFAKLPSLRTDKRVAADGTEEVRVAADVTPEILAQVQALGGQIISSLPHSFHGRIPVTKAEEIAALPGIHFVGPYQAPRLRGTSDPQGDEAHNGPATRATYGVSGAGQTIGVISDSDDSTPSGALAAAQASGAVGTVNVVTVDGVSQSGNNTGTGTGEGLAMLEIVHALAPQATEWFATGATGDTPMAENIAALQQAGCKIIVDDVGYFDETPFEDGPIGQAINTFTAQGGLYFSAAGNDGNVDLSSTTYGFVSTWEGNYAPAVSDGYQNWGNGVFQNDMAVSSEGVYLYWADANGPAGSDASLPDNYELLITDGNGNIEESGSQFTNDSGQLLPAEYCAGNEAQTYAVVELTRGSGVFIHLYVPDGEVLYGTDGAIFGHCGNPNAIAVGATDSANANGKPFTGGAANPSEYFSSDGPRRYFFNPDGSAITSGNSTATGGSLLNKPDLTAADDVTTTLGTNSELNPFYGTSAAAPHAAAIAALILSYNPKLTNTQVKQLMESSALDIMATGWDRDSGYGIAMPGLAIASAGGGSVASAQISVAGASADNPRTGGATLTFPVTLSSSSTSAVTVQYATSDGTAQAGTDYTETSGTLTIPAGQTSANINVTVLGREFFGSNLQFTLTLSNPTNGSLKTASATGTIVEVAEVAPQVVGITPSGGSSASGAPYALSAVYTDGNGSSDIAQAEIQVGPTTSGTNTLNAVYNRASNLLYLFDNSDANEIGGYTPGSNISISNSQGTLNCAATTVTLAGNDLTVNWNFTPAASFAGEQNVYGSVSDNEGESSGLVPVTTWTVTSGLGISIAGGTARVGTSGTVPFDFDVTLSAASTLPVTVNYATANGTAVAGTDYTATSGTLTIPAGSLTATIPVSVTGTTANTTGLTFNVVLSSPANAVLTNATGTATILHDTGPVNVSLTPLPQSTLVDAASTLTETISDVSGASAITDVKICLGALALPSASLYAEYNASTKLLYLYNASNVAVGGFAPGSANVITTTLGSLNCAGTTVTDSGNDVVIAWNFTPAASLEGARPTFLQATNVYGEVSAWSEFGTWTISAPGPSLVSAATLPLSTETGAAGTITATYADGGGASALTEVQLCLGQIALPSASLYAKYVPSTNLLYLFNASNVAVGGFAPGTSNVITVPLGSLNCAETTVTQSGNDLTVNWNITSGTTTGGVYPVNLYAQDASANTGWQSFGNWTVYSAGAGVTSVTPLPLTSNAGTAATFTATYSDGGGASALTRVQFCAGPVGYPSTTLYAEYVVSSNLLYLFNASNVAAGGFAPGSDNVITTLLGSLNCASTTVTKSGDNLVVAWNITPTTAIEGAQAVNLYAQDASGTTGWVGFGTWTINAPVPSVVSVATLPLASTAGTAETLTATYSDGGGAGALTEVQLCVGPVGSPATTMYVRYNPGTNLLYLYNGSDTALGGFAPGSANTITTSLGSLNCAATTVTKSGNNLVVKWSITPTTALEGVQAVNLNAVDADANTNWKGFGDWTISAATTSSVTPSGHAS